jgi:phage terminase large subunit
MIAAAEQLRNWRQHPARMVRELFGVTPDPWQAEILEAFPRYQRLAMKAAKGPGKSCVLAWCSWNFLLTRPNPKIAMTSITGDNLRDGLWAEMAKWRSKSPLLEHAFEWTKSRIFLRTSPETWFCSARTWPRDADAGKQAETLAGLHADYILFVLDESGGIPDSVMAAAEAALSSCVEGHLVQAGNPSMLSGPLYRAATSERRLWYVVEITGDPDNAKRSSRISVQWAREQIEKYGRDNPWVKINVFGEFPPSSLNALIGPDEVAAAMKRTYREYDIGSAPRILGIDVARFGADSSAIARRWGLQAFRIEKFRNLTSTQGAGRVARVWEDWGADACFIDDSGGFGSGWVDQLRQLGRAPIPIHFAGEPHNKTRFANKRSEMFFELVEWIRRGGALPESAELTAALSQTTYAFKGDKLILEPKDSIKAKIGFSPDEGDALALTFAEKVHSAHARRRGDPYRAIQDWKGPWHEPEDERSEAW